MLNLEQRNTADTDRIDKTQPQAPHTPPTVYPQEADVISVHRETNAGLYELNKSYKNKSTEDPSNYQQHP